MARSTYFVQECPTCGRKVEIRVEYLGRQVVCQHCRGALTASDHSIAPTIPTIDGLMHRADQLLDLADSFRSLPQPH